ncbi:MAG: hypothetical protein H6843_08045 [Rhodospirillaceae bacterium]|nr:hypothetical protein [Rhodospirillaceae bacterium]
MARTGSNGGPHYRPRGGILVGLAGWVALVGVTGAVGWLALGACGLAWRDGQPVLDFCPAPAAAPPPSTALLVEEQRGRELEDRLAQLRLALIAAPDCPAPPAPEIVVAALEEEPPPEPEPHPAPVFDLPQHRPDPPPLPEPREQVAELPPAPQADIPEDAWDRRDTAFLEGCWTLISPQSLQDTQRGINRPMADWRICFDANGNGYQTIGVSDGDRCTGGVRAQFTPGGSLSMTSVGDIPCNGGSVPQIIQDCQRQADGTAQCVGRQPSANRYGIVSTFRR